MLSWNSRLVSLWFLLAGSSDHGGIGSCGAVVVFFPNRWMPLAFRSLQMVKAAGIPRMEDTSVRLAASLDTLQVNVRGLLLSLV